MSAPHISGICALLLEARLRDAEPVFTSTQMKAILIASAQSTAGSAFDERWGFGIVDAVAAEQLIR